MTTAARDELGPQVTLAATLAGGFAAALFQLPLFMTVRKDLVRLSGVESQAEATLGRRVEPAQLRCRRAQPPGSNF